jgi:serine/threonine-protein kinase
VPPGIDALIKKGLSVEKAERFKDADEMVAELHAALERISDDVLDALPAKTGAVGSKESGSGSGAEKSSKAAGSASQRRSAVPGPLPKASDAKAVPFDQRATIQAVEAYRDTATPHKQERPSAASLNVARVLAVMVPVMLLAAGVTLFMVKRGEQNNELKPVVKIEPAPEPARAAPELLTVTLKSTPSGASVLEDGVLVGTTPLDRKWPKETTHAITFQLTGYQELQRAIRPEKSESFEVELVSAKKGPPAGPDKGKTKPKPGDGIEAFE